MKKWMKFHKSYHLPRSIQIKWCVLKAGPYKIRTLTHRNQWLATKMKSLPVTRIKKSKIMLTSLKLIVLNSLFLILSKRKIKSKPINLIPHRQTNKISPKLWLSNRANYPPFQKSNQQCLMISQVLYSLLWIWSSMNPPSYIAPFQTGKNQSLRIDQGSYRNLSISLHRFFLLQPLFGKWP